MAALRACAVNINQRINFRGNVQTYLVEANAEFTGVRRYCHPVFSLSFTTERAWPLGSSELTDDYCKGEKEFNRAGNFRPHSFYFSQLYAIGFEAVTKQLPLY